MFSLWHALGHTVHALLQTHALPVIALVVFIEELGIPSPLPGELMMLLAGVKAAQGVYPLWLVLLVQEIAAVVGGCGLYAICRHVGRPLVLRYGRYIHLHAATLERAEAQIRRYGIGAIAIGRMIPGVCIVVPIAAGALDVPFGLFLPAFAVGAFVYIGALTLGGYALGPYALTLFERVTPPIGALVSLGVLVGLLIAGRKLAPRLPPSVRGRGVAVLAGGFAGVAGLLAADTVVGLARWGYTLLSGTSPLAAAGVGTGWRLLLGWPVFLPVACGLGAADGWLLRRHVPFIARTTLLAVAPLLLTVLVVYPLTEGHAARWTQPRGLLLLAVEVARWLAFGVALHLVLPLVIEGSPLPTMATPHNDTATAAPLVPGSGP